MERNFETVMIEQCAPVLASLKPAGLFRYETRDCADLARRVKNWNEQLQPKGLRVRVLKGCARTQLSRRLCCSAEFPHEIGVFLGYPLSDVVGFIENSGRNFTCCGCWKAYGDPQAAQRHFAQLRKCTAVYLRLFHSGTPILRLAVAA